MTSVIQLPLFDLCNFCKVWKYVLPEFNRGEILAVCSGTLQ